ncbi:MAG: sodium/proton-translocating pyrophosphatase [Fimbriimonas sp.]
MNALKQWIKGGLTARLTTLFTILILTLVPMLAMASGGENVVLAFTADDQKYLWASLVFGVIALAYGFYLRGWVLAHSPGSEKMQEVGLAIREGALAYLRQQVMTMLWFVGALFVGLVLLYQDRGIQLAILTAVAFVLGVASSYIAGYAGMVMAINGNMRTAHAALTSYKTALEVAFRSGAVAGMVTVGMGLIGATVILLAAGQNATTLLVGFGFGGSLAALFMRVGGGIFTKAADVGADLVGKVEAGIPEDDPRNPATIADNVGDNVGDCAGMAADIFESYEVTLVAAIVLGAATAAIFDQATWTKLILFALMARGVGIIASVIGIHFLKGTEDLDADPLKPIRRGFQLSAVVSLVMTAVLAYFMMGGSGAKIGTSALVQRGFYERAEFELLQNTQRQIADNLRKESWQVSAKDVLNTPAVKAAGFDEREESAVASVLSTDVSKLAPLKPTTGFVKVTNFEDTKAIPGLAFAMQARQDPAGPPPTSQFTTVGANFGGADNKLIIAELAIKADLPARPGANGQPPVPAEKIDRKQWVGPIREKDLDKQLEAQRKSAIEQKITATITKLDVKTVDLYYNAETKDFALAFPLVARPHRLAGQENLSYFKVDVPTIEKVAQDARNNQGQAAAIPPQATMDVLVVNSTPVEWWRFFACIAFGVVLAFAIEALTDYYVSTHKKPTQEVAGVATAGPAPMIIQGFAYGLESSVFMVFAIVIALIFPLFIFDPAQFGGYLLSFYGVALVGLGLLTTTGYVLAMDTFGPISDNAQGVYEMSGEGHDNARGARAVQLLDAAGNTTKALTKGFAITTAVVAAVALFHSYLEGAKLGGIGLRLDLPEIFLGMLIGGAAPFLFSAFAINAVGRAAFELINEVRRQFREDAGIMAGTSKPNYARCVAIVTAAAQRELLGPGVLAIALPVAVAFGFAIGKPAVQIGDNYYNLTGAQALGGFLAGTILTGQLMAVLLANSGGMWDNAKKLIEDGLHGGKGTEAHKAAVVCDTVGDPFKDTAGPALNPLIKVMNLVALLIAPVVIQPLGTNTLVLITAVALALLAGSIYISKKGSMSTALQSATSEVSALEAAAAAPATPEPSAKKKITVEDDEA